MRNNTSIRRGIAAALLAAVFGLGAASLTAHAEPMERAETELSTNPHVSETGRSAVWTGLSSRGSLVYGKEEQGARIYAADFLLLRDRLDTIPDVVFDPVCYTHTHQWEYLDVNGETHTRHCKSCGNAFDLISAHKANQWESCTLSHGGAKYPGIRYTCICGYQWEREETHTLYFEAVDKTSHRSRCRLDGTKCCPGYESVMEEHYAYHYVPCGDGCHHEKICMDCGYRDVEECCFSLPDMDSSGEDGGNGSSGRRCWCGNVEKADSGTETGDEDVDEETRGENTDAEDEGENMETESGDENVEAEPEQEETQDSEVEAENSGEQVENENQNAEAEAGKLKAEWNINKRMTEQGGRL